MLIFNIHDYDDFKYVFGLDHHGNGVKSRRNKILLQHIKNRSLIRYCRERNDWSLLHIRNMATLKSRVLSAIQQSGKQNPELKHKVQLLGSTYWSAQYQTDYMEGLCEDFDKRAVRYVSVKANRVYKMKAGKFFASIIRETEIGQILSEPVINWLAEEFTQDWQTYTYGKTPEVKLHVDGNFEKIYDEYWCRDFNGCSCMVGRGRHYFYMDSVKAKAAYLTDVDGFILARAVIFTDVTDQDGRKWRLLERQYSKESNEVLKRLLVDMCIKGDHIDGYKQVGAGCSEATTFVANDGTSLSEKKFQIECKLGMSQVLSYQDSFKYFDYDSDTAYNYRHDRADYNLDVTDYNLEGDDDGDDEQDTEYDDYHDYDCRETTMCYYRGSQVYVDIDNLEDFIEVDNDYYHKDDVTQCDECGNWIVKAQSLYNSDAEVYFCNSDCEAKYIREHYFYSEYDDDYFHHEEDVTTIHIWNEKSQTYNKVSISCLTRDNLIREGKAFGAGDLWFTTAA